MNQLKPVLIEDFNEIKSPSSLQYSPDEKTLAFMLVQPDKENNKYSKNLWIMEENQSAAKKRMIWKRKRRFTASIFMAESQSRRFLFQGPYPFLRSFQMAYIVWESRKIEIHFY